MLHRVWSSLEDFSIIVTLMKPRRFTFSIFRLHSASRGGGGSLCRHAYSKPLRCRTVSVGNSGNSFVPFSLSISIVHRFCSSPPFRMVRIICAAETPCRNGAMTRQGSMLVSDEQGIDAGSVWRRHRTWLDLAICRISLPKPSIHRTLAVFNPSPFIIHGVLLILPRSKFSFPLLFNGLLLMTDVSGLSLWARSSFMRSSSLPSVDWVWSTSLPSRRLSVVEFPSFWSTECGRVPFLLVDWLWSSSLPSRRLSVVKFPSFSSTECGRVPFFLVARVVFNSLSPIAYFLFHFSFLQISSTLGRRCSYLIQTSQDCLTVFGSSCWTPRDLSMQNASNVILNSGQ